MPHLVISVLSLEASSSKYYYNCKKRSASHRRPRAAAVTMHLKAPLLFAIALRQVLAIQYTCSQQEQRHEKTSPSHLTWNSCPRKRHMLCLTYTHYKGFE